MSVKRFYTVFTRYSSFLSIAHTKGIYVIKDEKNNFRKPPLPEGMEGIIWGGPLLSHETEDLQMDNRGINENLSDKQNTSLPPPPYKAISYKPYQLLAISKGLRFGVRSYKSFVSQLGSPFLFYPLTLLTFGSFALLYLTKNILFASPGIISIGIILFLHSFVLIQRKRAIENCPTSKIRSMPMGEVEIKGYAKPKYSLRSPYTKTNCIYYSYKIYKREKKGNTWQYVVKEIGYSGSIPFYIEDDTGKVLVKPENAIVHAGVEQTLSGVFLDTFYGPSALYSVRDTKIVEKVIPVSQFLYIKGFAHPLRLSTEKKQSLIIEKLRQLKKNKGHLNKYDLNKDGKISMDEWEDARRDIEEKVILEGYEKDSIDRIAIGEHPSGGLFYISDKQEEGLIRSMNIRIPIFFISGIGFIIGGIILLLKTL